jgi:hypothetical protein
MFGNSVANQSVIKLYKDKRIDMGANIKGRFAVDVVKRRKYKMSEKGVLPMPDSKTLYGKRTMIDSIDTVGWSKVVKKNRTGKPRRG